MKKNGWKTANKEELEVMKKAALDNLKAAFTKDTERQNDIKSNEEVEV